ncbi:hypothetical protein CH63R_09209 [Colletotrichum higginsianum IMI 349063]|uniref:Uncharacterized protein n=2 Tax=Colletotrichum higginsianum TaxID=80884 RepID=A0A1B7Y6X5_COLHI|nr:hypothetical protein CH63R_09209 [Colletotrichum higginsianum IMI 349063]OBR07688.1 hypothetical protein CH63R_09209 [Colletotrichum higginsianum IMI 349063]TIC91740.1 hypothetical protein CH35J_010614 [Colletotrichum higginsianum]GJC98216.1 hypothetical protein ColKHC_07042 [Colletotrichum higginsianum]
MIDPWRRFLFHKHGAVVKYGDNRTRGRTLHVTTIRRKTPHQTNLRSRGWTSPGTPGLRGPEGSSELGHHALGRFQDKLQRKPLGTWHAPSENLLYLLQALHSMGVKFVAVKEKGGGGGAGLILMSVP